MDHLTGQRGRPSSAAAMHPVGCIAGWILDFGFSESVGHCRGLSWMYCVMHTGYRSFRTMPS